MSLSIQRGLRLLSFDGGGIRGLASLVILKEILYKYKTQKHLEEVPKPCEMFDLAGGTSTGGLIVIMLFRLQMTIDEAITSYVDLAKKVFKEKKWFIQDGSFKATRLEEAILQVIQKALDIGDEDARKVQLLDANSPNCFVCSVSSQNMAFPTLFRSWKPSRLAFHQRTTIVEAARATSAAPTFFRSIDIEGDEGLAETFIDGGMRYNNPVQYVLNEAESLFPGREIAYVLSLGTGVPDVIKISDDNVFKRLLPTNLRLIKVLVNIATDCESTANKVGEDLPRDQYYRLNVNRGLEQISLSEWEKLDDVILHTRQYLKENDAKSKVDKLVAKMYMSPTVVQAKQ